MKQLLAAVLAAALSLPAGAGDGEPVRSDLWVAGAGGWHTYRIPALLATDRGTLLAFCEGRRAGRGDAGDVDLLLRRSSDGGQSFEPTRVLWDDGANTCGNPCALYDRATRSVWLFATHSLGSDSERALVRGEAQGARRVFALSSADEGLSWSAPREITSSVKAPAWGWYATGPGVGIQLEHGAHAGRLIVPADHSFADPAGAVAGGGFERGAHVFWSDDGGASFALGGLVRPRVDECQVVELADAPGALLVDMRSYAGRHRRAQAQSRDGGASFDAPRDASALVEPVCQASLLRFSWPGPGTRSRILFANPASERREALTVRLSHDEAASWSAARVLAPGPAAYSSLAVVSSGDELAIGCLFETGAAEPYERLTLARFSLEWLSDGADRALPPAESEYLGRTIARTMHWRGGAWLLRATREDEEAPARLLDALALEPGARVADFGCGNGYHSLRLAERVGPTGVVYAIDIQRPFLDELDARAAAAGLANVRTLLGTPIDPRLPAGSCDLILVADVYHELGNPDLVLAQLRRALAPGGVVALVEFRAEDPNVPIKPEHKMTKAQARAELEANGFRLAREFDGLPWQHLLVFEREDS